MTETETETETETPGLGRPVYVAADVGTGTKALDDNGRVEEITFDGTGTIMGLDFTEHGAYFALAGPDGIVHSHGSVAIATTKSDRLAYTYQTLGRSVGDSKLVELGCAFVSSPRAGWRRLTRQCWY
jgi:hypothetical protein